MIGSAVACDEGAHMSDLLLKQLASIGCRGPVITPGSADYDRARQVWNGVSDRRPAAVLRAADVDDVRKAIDVAANCNGVLAIRGGGHSLPGLSTCDGGLLLDLSIQPGWTSPPEPWKPAAARFFAIWMQRRFQAGSWFRRASFLTRALPVSPSAVAWAASAAPTG